MESIDKRFNNHVSNSIRDIAMLFNLLQNKFHELTSWSVYCKHFSLVLLLSSISNTFISVVIKLVLSSNKLESNLYQDVKIVEPIKTITHCIHLDHRFFITGWVDLVVAEWLCPVAWVFFHFIFLNYISCTIFSHHILNNIILSIQDDISELTEVFNHIPSFKLSINNYIVLLINFEVWILNEFFNDRIEDSIEVSTLRQPGSTW